VNNQYLWKVLVRFSSPSDFIKIIKSLYHHAGSKILINGFFTEKNMVSPSVRLGCPMSMALFVLFIEPMIRAINHNTSAVIVNNQLMKVFSYDVNYNVTTDEQSDRISMEITKFMNESHVSIDISKSSFQWLNQRKMGFQLLREHGSLQILGIKLERNGGPNLLQGSHKQDFIFVSSACKVSPKSVAESLDFKFVCFVEIMVCGPCVASRKHTYQKDKKAAWKLFVERQPL
jgi:hypothetical protein